jgi:hypothetical protein
MKFAWHVVIGLIGLMVPMGLSPTLHAQWTTFSIDVSKPLPEYPIGTAVPTLCPVRVSMRTSPIFLASSGYQPVRFRIRPATGRTFPSDGTVTVRLHFEAYGAGKRTAMFEIPVRAGAPDAESGMLVNCPRGHLNMRVQCAWNGTYYQHLSANGYVAWSPVLDTMRSPSRLFLTSADSTWMNSSMRKGRKNLQGPELPIAWGEEPANRNQSNLSSDPQWREYLTDIDIMPKEWLQMASIDQVNTTLKELQQLDASGRRSLNQYLWCGGTLCLLDEAPLDELKESINAEWERVASDKELKSEVYRAGFGSVVLKPEKGRSALDKWPSRNRIERLSGTMRDEYWNWLIPEVGKTPVWTFFGIVVLLVGIGAPAILIWSQRIQRRIWTVLAIPVLSLVSVLSLFVYGTIKDGWTSLVRIRSLTILDAEGNGAVWSRQTYFAGSLPGGKIKLSSDAELIPLRSRESSDLTQYQDDTGQEYSGVLSLRRQNQVCITHPVQNTKLLRMGSLASGVEGLPESQNDSELTLRAVVCCDPSGRVYQSMNVPPKGKIAWQESTPEDAAKRLKQLYDEQALVVPADAPDDRTYSIFDFFRVRSIPWNPAGAVYSEFTEEEEWQSRLTTWGDKAPRKFMAVVDRAPQLEKCLPEARETGSLHMVIGTW